MGFWGVLLLMLAGGYVLGIWTAATVLRERQPAYEAGRPEELPELSRRPSLDVPLAWGPNR